MPTIIFIRGYSGTGKTTLAKQLSDKFGFRHIEADMFFEQDGSYNFNPALIGNAHEWARNKLGRWAEDGRNVVVSNTGIQLWEFDSYFEMLDWSKCNVMIIELRKEGDRANYVNAHGLDQKGLDRQKSRWQNLKGGATKVSENMLLIEGEEFPIPNSVVYCIDSDQWDAKDR